jgi:hypothetical protein
VRDSGVQMMHSVELSERQKVWKLCVQRKCREGVDSFISHMLHFELVNLTGRDFSFSISPHIRLDRSRFLSRAAESATLESIAFLM